MFTHVTHVLIIIIKVFTVKGTKVFLEKLRSFRLGYQIRSTRNLTEPLHSGLERLLRIPRSPVYRSRSKKERTRSEEQSWTKDYSVKSHGGRTGDRHGWYLIGTRVVFQTYGRGMSHLESYVVPIRPKSHLHLFSEERE